MGKQKEVSDKIAEETEGVESTEEEKSEDTEETTEESEELGKKEEDFFPKTDEEGEEEGDTSEDPEEDATSEEDDGKEELIDELSLDDFDELEEPQEKKSGVQKRIDQLTARLKTIEEENATLKNSTSDKKTEYSEAQLRKALSKAMDEGDSNLMWEIMDYRISSAEKQAVGKYQKESKEANTKSQKHTKEWISVVEENEYLSDEKEPELYKGSHRELNLSDQNSTVFKLATKLYTDPERSDRYLKDGGQRLAVSDAIRMILRKRNTKTTSKETKKLKRQLTKEKKKSTVSSGKSIKTESSKPVTARSNLEDYINDRKKSKETIAGGF